MHPPYDDADAEGEPEHDAGAAGMTLVSPGGLESLGLAPPPSSAPLAAAAGVGKRYRPAPAKTFQCRGFGECRMVFSRSEHLARHVRKHTGERPFTCHCAKQFSRLDNLRQHAQTVHADRAAQNEAMMRELTSLHASMTGQAPASAGTGAAPSGGSSSVSPTASSGAGAGKKGGKRARAATGGAGATTTTATEAAPPSNGNATSPATSGTGNSTPTAGVGAGDVRVKHEPEDSPRMDGAVRPRPGTSTGYEGAAGAAGYGGEMDLGREEREGWMDVDETHPHAAHPSPPLSGGGARSFRGPFPPAFDRARRDSRDRESQFFLGPAHAHAHLHSGGSGQSFRGHPYARRSPPALTPSPPVPTTNGNANGLTPSRIPSGPFPGGAAFSSATRPFSSGGRRFSAISADADDVGNFAFSLPNAGPAFPASGGVPLSSSSGSRPSTGNTARLPPLSAVVSAAAFRPTSGHGYPIPGSSGSILLPNSLTLRRPSTGDWEWDSWSIRPGTAPGKLPTAAVAPIDDSPFSFHPPEPTAYGGGNSRKRAFGGPDGPYGAHPDDDGSGGGGAEYGSDSRPASRRLSVMELCNDNVSDQRPASAISLLRGGSAERERERERPTTTNGLVSRASALVLHDREQQRGEHEPRHAGEQYVAADRNRPGSVRGSRSRAGSVRAYDATAPGGAAAGGARPVTSGRGDGGVSAAAGAGGAFLPAAAAPGAGGGGGAAARGGALSSAADAAASAASAVPRSVRAAESPSPRSARDGHGGPDGAGYGDVSPTSAHTPALGAYGHGHGHGAGGRISLSPPAPRLGLAGGGLSGVPPARADALPGLGVFARLPGSAYAAGLPPLRGDDAVRGVHRRVGSDDGVQRDAGVRFSPGGRTEVREFPGVGRGPGAGGYEYEYDEQPHRLDSGRGGGMRV